MSVPRRGRATLWVALISLGLALAACGAHTRAQATPQPSAAPPATALPTGTPSHTPTPRPSATPSPTHTATITPTPTPLPPLIVVDPGHGGVDLGARHFDASGHMDFCESQVNLDIALRLRDLLLARGYRVLMTRDGDYRIFDDQDVNGDGEVTHLDEVQARIDLANAAGADLLLSIHQNAYERADGGYVGDVGGTVVYYCADRPFAERSLLLAERVHAHLLEAFADLGHAVRDRGVWDDAILREPGEPGKHIVLLGPEDERTVRPSEMPGVLSETLFVTHDLEAQLARDPVALDRFALAYADAIDAYWAALGEQAALSPP